MHVAALFLLQCLPLLSFSPPASRRSRWRHRHTGIVVPKTTPLLLLPIDVDTLDTGAVVVSPAFTDAHPAPSPEDDTLTSTPANQSAFYPVIVVTPDTASVKLVILRANASVSAISNLLLRSAAVGIASGVGVVAFKRCIHAVSSLLFVNLADMLPKPAFYWPIILYPLIGGAFVSLLTWFSRDLVSQNIDVIAHSISPPVLLSTVLQENNTIVSPTIDSSVERKFSLPALLTRSMAAVATLGSGCSLGPEGTSVEIGASMARLFAGASLSEQQTRFLFLAGTSAGVSAGFNAPITGVFFALECGNRYLRRNTLKFERVDEGPRADVAAIVLAAAVSALVVEWGLQGQSGSLQITGNSYAMASPLFELPAYLGLGLVCGGVASVFVALKDRFTAAYEGRAWGKASPLARTPAHLRPLLGGLACGLGALLLPQTMFSSYASLDQLIAGSLLPSVDVLLSLLLAKIVLTSFSLASGLVGGVFAPSLFFGATAGGAYHHAVEAAVTLLKNAIIVSGSVFWSDFATQFLVVANAPAFAAVGAAATLGALFRAPLTASMLMFEITQNHDMVLPLLASCGLAGLFAEVLSNPQKQW